MLANVAPSVTIENKTLGYHSTRHTARKEALSTIIPLYKELLEIEKRSGIDASYKKLQNILQEKGVSYDEFILSI